MDELEAIEVLAEQARREEPPVTNISIGNIRKAALVEPARLFPWVCTGAVSALAAAAAICLVLRVNTASASSPTISPLFNVAQVEMP